MSKNKNLPEIVVPKVTRPGWAGGAYTLTFVYSNKGNFVLKGFYADINMYLEELKTLGYKYFCNHTLWHKGVHRSIWSFYKKDVYITEPKSRWRFYSSYSKNRRFYFQVNNFKTKTILTYKRLPNKWVKDFELL